jgi:hypothetical protein
MYVPRHARHGGADRVLHPLAGGVGEYSEGTRGRTAIVCAREWCGHARPPAPRIRYSNGSRSNGPSSPLLAGYSEGTRGVLTGPCVEPSARGSGRRRAGHSQRVLTEHEHARGYCQRYRVPHGAAPLQGGCCQRTRGHVRRGHAHGSATVRAGARRGAYGHQRAGGRTQAHGAASRAGRAHRKLSSLSADSAAGIVPSSELLRKALRRAWFVPLCSEMRMHRSVPRTHIRTARGGRMGPRPRGYCTRVLEGCAARVPSSCPGDERHSSRAAVRTHLEWYLHGYSKGHQRLTRTVFLTITTSS